MRYNILHKDIIKHFLVFVNSVYKKGEKMCRFCGKYLCPAGCPNYEGRSAERGRVICRCALCGSLLREDDIVEFSYGKPYCFKCSDRLFNDIRGKYDPAKNNDEG